MKTLTAFFRFGDMCAAMSPGGIELQEAAGTKDFIAAPTLPKKCPREDLEKLGFVFEKDVDDLFINVRFPHGWSKRARNHFYSDLLDDRMRVRGDIFYKAAFYDRRAHMYLRCRYSIAEKYFSDKTEAVQYQAFDEDKVIFETKLIEHDPRSDEYWATKQKLEQAATAYLVARFPDWRNPLAYWSNVHGRVYL